MSQGELAVRLRLGVKVLDQWIKTFGEGHSNAVLSRLRKHPLCTIGKVTDGNVLLFGASLS